MSVKSICGVILVSENPEALASFYSRALGLHFTREEHGELAPHWGVDIGAIHFGIHPPENFSRASVGKASAVLAFNVESLAECQSRLMILGRDAYSLPTTRVSGW